MSTAVDKAKDTLLRALDELERAEQDLDAGVERVDLVVTYSIGADLGEGGWHEIAGWSATAGPKWLHAALLRRAADAQDTASRAIDDDRHEEDDGDA